MDRTAGEAGELGLRAGVSVCEAGLARAGGNQPGWRTEVSQDRTKGCSAKLWARRQGRAGFPEVAVKDPMTERFLAKGVEATLGNPCKKPLGLRNVNFSDLSAAGYVVGIDFLK